MSGNKLPFTKDGYRYILCEDDEALCSKYLDDFNKIEPNKRSNTVHFKRMVVNNYVKLSYCDRAPQLKLDQDELTVTGEKGYSMIRATHGMNRGAYYYEVKILSMPNDSAARIGWGQCYANLQAPLGYDRFGYSWRSVFGTKFHQARGKTYDLGDEQRNNRGFKAGDTIGCMIELPYHDSKKRIEPHQLPPSIKGHASLLVAKKKEKQRTGEVEDKPPAANSLNKHTGSRISFFKNGVQVGVAFEDIFEGTYYPSISLYKNCTVSANFGPNFNYPPKMIKNDIHSGDMNGKHEPYYLPAQDMAEILIVDHLLADILFVVDAEYHYEEKEGIFLNVFEAEINELKKEVLN